MTLRDDLEKEIQEASWLEYSCEDSRFSAFIRDHGKDILDVLARYEALRCESDILCQAIRGYNFAGVGPTEDPFVESCVLAVESCLFKTKAVTEDSGVSDDEA